MENGSPVPPKASAAMLPHPRTLARRRRVGVVPLGIGMLVVAAGAVAQSWAEALPGGTLDPTTIPKYVTPLVIPPVMKNSGDGR